MRQASYEFAAVEARWRRRWEEVGIYRTPEPSSRPKRYVLDFFPYPSGAGLSVGHARNYVPTDALARYFRMRGFAVLHPMGWDAFGLPAENEALLRGRHPRETTREYAATYRAQLTLLGCSYDWSREISTSDPEFYRWTQWGFLLLHRRGLAYRAAGWQWWCPHCRTILANEQVEDGRCWRHRDVPVERRALHQWYIRTTVYAERLLGDLDALDWPEHIVTMQRNWIGRSQGSEVRFPIAGGAPEAAGSFIAVFTTRVDTLFGATFLALAPEHPLAALVAVPARRAAVEAFRQDAMRGSEIERSSPDRSPSGIDTGTVAIHPLTGAHLPIYIADYVLALYGSGAVMGVPAHDDRDYRFAVQLGLPIRPVVRGPGDTGLPFPGEGLLADSGEFSGLTTEAARKAITEVLQRRGAGGPAVRYRLHDWLISRQRYWGAPIPIVHCGRCGTVPVPETDLPVRLPDVARYEPSGTGRSPLAAIPEFVATTCPRCGGAAERETDTLDGFADSNWYFLRFADPHHHEGPWHPEAARYWLPVDWYIGGAEQAVMHLLYARFFTKVLFDEGLVNFQEPFVRLRSQGSLLSPLDGARMSKSRGNVVTPDEVVAAAGADALRVAVMFIGPFDRDVMWDPDAARGASRFVARLSALFRRAAGVPARDPPAAGAGDAAAVARRLHELVRDAGTMIEGFRFNVLIAALMTALNDLEHLEPAWRGTAVWREAMLAFVRVLAPVVPFLAEQAWADLGQPGSVHQASWPEVDPEAIGSGPGTVIVQVDGRLRGRMTVPGAEDRAALITRARALPGVAAAIGGRAVADVVVVPGRVINFVTR